MLYLNDQKFSSIPNRKYTHSGHTGTIRRSWFLYYRRINTKIEKAILNLPESYRVAFEMHRFQNKTYQEIAEELNISSKTVDYRIQQALKQLRKELKDYLPLLLFFLPLNRNPYILLYPCTLSLHNWYDDKKCFCREYMPLQKLCQCSQRFTPKQDGKFLSFWLCSPYKTLLFTKIQIGAIKYYPIRLKTSIT